MLTRPEGRAALKQFGIDVQLASAQDQKQEQEKPVVAVLCPTYRAPEPQMQDALAAMVAYTRKSDVATVYGGPPMQSSVVHWSRNGLVSEQLKSGKPWTHILFIDDDIVVEQDTLVRLLSHDKDIVAGLCTRRQDPPVPNIRFYDEETGDFRQIWEWPEDKLIEVGAVGTGLMLVSRHAFEQVAQAYFDCLWEKDFYDVSEAWIEKQRAKRLDEFDRSKICYWFRFQQGFGMPVEYGEDLWFCMVAKRYAQISTFVDTAVQPGHIGNYAFSVRDFVPFQQDQIQRAKIHGQYPIDVPEMKISILCPTRGRPENVKRLLDSIRETSTVLPQVLLYADFDDSLTTGTNINYLGEHYPIDKLCILGGPRITLSDMWNQLAERASGEILMQAGDDIVFRTKGWDDQVRRAFAAFEDRLIFLHGDDKAYGASFGTHGFLHRAWIKATGYFCPPYFSADCADTWLNEVANQIGRRVALPFVTEHLHPYRNQAGWDQTYEDAEQHRKSDKPLELYAKLAPERKAEAEKLRALLGKPYGESVPARQSELVTV